MKLELILFGITGFLIYNTYYDGKYSKLIKMNMKYIKMATYAFGALSLYIFMKKFPNHGKSMLVHANDMIRYMPIDKNTSDLITPILNFTNENKDKFDLFNSNKNNQDKYQYHNYNQLQQNSNNNLSPFQQKNLNQQYSYREKQRENNINTNNTKKYKRSVSETKKKYVASNQNWKCGHCNMQLDHTFEIDHIIDLQFGGTNNVDNLVALCRNCHGKKTMSRHI